MASIFDMFSSKGGATGGQASATPPTDGAANATPAPGATPPANTPPANSADSNPTVPNATNTPVVTDTVTGSQAKSPLDNYKDIWETGTIKPPEPLFDVTNEKMLEAASKVDFRQVVTPELLARVKAGGEDAVAAQMEITNKIAQTVYGNSAIATTKIVQQAVEKTRQEFMASLPELIRGQNVDNLLRTENPIFDNPAISPILSAIEGRMRSKNPTLTASQVATKAREYFLDMSSEVQAALNPVKDLDASGKPKRKEVDWSLYLPE